MYLSLYKVICIYWFRIFVILLIVIVKVKVKVTLVQALRLCTGRTAHKGSRGIAVL
jgi:hypothetical protein